MFLRRIYRAPALIYPVSHLIIFWLIQFYTNYLWSQLYNKIFLILILTKNKIKEP